MILFHRSFDLAPVAYDSNYELAVVHVIRAECPLIRTSCEHRTTAGLNLNIVTLAAWRLRHSSLSVESSPVLTLGREKAVCKEQRVFSCCVICSALEAMSTVRVCIRSGRSCRSVGQICRGEVRGARGRHGGQKTHLDCLRWEHECWYATTVGTRSRNPCSTVGHSNVANRRFPSRRCPLSFEVMDDKILLCAEEIGSTKASNPPVPQRRQRSNLFCLMERCSKQRSR
jgi:hypothetical protein